MKKQKILFVLLVFTVLLALAAFPVRAEEYNGLQYRVSTKHGALIIEKYTGTDTEIVIPSSIAGKKVQELDDYAFNECNGLTSVTLPDTVDTIGKYAFNLCSSLKHVNIPSGVRTIQEGTFINCENLESITIPDTVTSIGIDAFWNCAKLMEIRIPDSVTDIDRYAFCGCSGLTRLEIPDSVTSLCGDDPLVGADTFRGCRNLKSIRLPKKITVIGYGMFQNCTSLTSINIPEGVTHIGSYAFDGCDNLSSMLIPESIVSISESAFGSGASLKTIYGKTGSMAESLARHKGWAFFDSSAWKEDMAACRLTITNGNLTYTGQPLQCAFTVTNADGPLVENRDYTVTYANNINAGTATLTVTGMGGYTGTLSGNFTIKKAEQTVKASLSATVVQIGQTLQITAEGKGAVSYRSDSPAIAAVNAQGVVTGLSPGTAAITVSAAGDGNYNPADTTVTVTVMAERENTSPGNDEGDSTGTSSGNGAEDNTGTSSGNGTEGNTGTSSGIAQKQTQTITVSSKTVAYKSKPFSLKAKASGDGKLTYKSSNTKVAAVSSAGKVTVKNYGQTTITVKAAANENYLAATRKITVKVVPKTPALKKAVSPGKKKLSASWGKDKTVDGYQMYLCLKKDFKKGTYERTYKKSSGSMTLTGLKSKKTYYIKLRSYKKVGTKKYYSAWSKIKKVKIK
ncbi:MAG TPA: hypothetical protein DF613_09705 [Lachnospiraceae bacterium]|nr:hypothetical protein [Lachnospiraceae bacterium]